MLPLIRLSWVLALVCGAAWSYLGFRLSQFGDPGAGCSAHANGRDVTTAIALDARRQSIQVRLVQHANLRHVTGADLGQQRVDCRNLLVARFGAQHQQAVATIITGLHQPVRLDGVSAEDDSLRRDRRRGGRRAAACRPMRSSAARRSLP